jgi:hypothetical protein
VKKGSVPLKCCSVGNDAEGEVVRVVFGEDGYGVWVGGVVADVDGWVTFGEELGFVMGHADAADVAAEVFAVDFEVEGGFDLIGGGEGVSVFVGGDDLIEVNLAGGEGPGLGELQAFGTASVTKPGTNGIDDKDVAHTAPNV